MTTPNIDTKALRELEAKATPAPWGKTPFEEKNDVCIWQPDGSWLANVGNWGNCQLIVEGEDGPDIQAHPDLERIETGHDANAEFIVALRNAAPALLDEIESLREKVERYKSAARNPGDGERHRGTSVAIQLVHAQMKREETEAERDALKDEVERLREALTPSGATKFAYMNEFKFNVVREGPDHSEIVERHAVPWTTIKDIMAAIAKRAALRGEEGN